MKNNVLQTVVILLLLVVGCSQAGSLPTETPKPTTSVKTATSSATATALPTAVPSSTPAIVEIMQDAYCWQDINGKEELIGVIQAGESRVILRSWLDGNFNEYLVEHLGQTCWIRGDALEKKYTVHPADLRQTMKWVILIERWMPDFEETLTVPLVLSVIMKESRGYPGALDPTGYGNSVGVMQVIPQPWLPCYNTLLTEHPADSVPCQIYAGMWLLDNIYTTRGNQDMRYTLAAYNCGYESVDNDNCHPWGGYVYADVVLDEILPVMEQAYYELNNQ